MTTQKIITKPQPKLKKKQAIILKKAYNTYTKWKKKRTKKEIPKKDILNK